MGYARITKKATCFRKSLFSNQSGSGNLIRTDDIPGMNRLLYQLSYAAILAPLNFSAPKLNKKYYSRKNGNVKHFLYFPRTDFRPHPSGMRPEARGISHGLKKCPPDTFSPRRCRGRPFDSLPRQIKKDILSDVLFLFAVRESKGR